MIAVDKICLGDPIRLRGHIIVPIEKTSVDAMCGQRWCFATKQPIGLIVKSAAGVKAYRLETDAIEIPQLQAFVDHVEIKFLST